MMVHWWPTHVTKHASSVDSRQKRFKLLLEKLVNLMTIFEFLNWVVGIIFAMIGLEQLQINCQKHYKKWWLINFPRFRHPLAFTLTLLHLVKAIEKECSKTCNYAKGHGDHLHHYMKTCHPNECFFAFARACGGSWQDIVLEGCPAVYMNLPYIVPFFYDRLSISNENILQKSLFVTFQSVEIIALLWVLSILYISVCLQTRWLSGNVRPWPSGSLGCWIWVL